MFGERLPRGLISAAVLLPAAGLAACSQTSPQGPAIVRGLAAGCQNPLGNTDVPITVIAKRRGQVVKRVDARFTAFRSRYQMQLEPGRYTISDPLSGAPSRTVTLRAGSATTLSFPNDC
jgi:hypothetical protein